MDSLNKIFEKFPPRREYLLSILLEVQKRHPQHFLEKEQMEAVAAYLGITRSAVFGVADYYSMLSLQARGSHMVCVCDSPVCCNAGSEELLVALKAHFKGQEEQVQVGQCACLGHCDDAPSVQCDGSYLKGTEIKTLIKEIEALIQNNGHA